MPLEVAGGSEESATVMTHVWPDTRVDPHVGVELPLTHEAALALLAGEGFLACVDSQMDVKLALLAALFAAPGAEEDRTHAGVGSHVRHTVPALGKNHQAHAALELLLGQRCRWDFNRQPLCLYFDNAGIHALWGFVYSFSDSVIRELVAGQSCC